MEEIIKVLKKHDYETNLYITEKRGDAKYHVKNLEHKDLVLSIGGDGTFNEIVTGFFNASLFKS